MRQITLSLVAAAVVAGASFAQTGPGVINDFAELSTMNQPTFANAGLYQSSGVQYIAQIQNTKGLGNAAGIFNCAMTLYSLAAQYGGASVVSGQDYVILGKYDASTQTFTPSTDALGMNDVTGGNFGLMLEPSIGREAVVDHADGVYFSYRANPLGPFPNATKITNWPAGKTYVDPALGKIGGVLHLFWADVDSNNANKPCIFAQPLTVSNGQATLSGTAFAVAYARSTATNIHSVSPIAGPDGNIHGLCMSQQEPSGDSDFCFKPDLNPNNDYFLVHDNTAWLNNGSLAAGSFFFANSGSAGGFYYAANSSDVAWMIAGETTVGGTSQVFGGGRNLTQGPGTMVILAAAGFGPGIKLGGVDGEFGLDLFTQFVFGAAVAPNADALAGTTVTIPQDPGFKGFKLPMQGLWLTVGPNGNTAFTNTCVLEVK
jgi:hypothetical protein